MYESSEYNRFKSYGDKSGTIVNESIPIFATVVNVLLIALTGIPPNVSSTVLTATVASAVPPSKFEIVIESAAV